MLKTRGIRNLLHRTYDETEACVSRYPRCKTGAAVALPIHRWDEATPIRSIGLIDKARSR